MNVSIPPSPPGDTILETIEHFGWSVTDFAVRMGLTEQEVAGLISGEAQLTEAHAHLLERELGISAGFWLAREANYRKELNLNQ